MWGIYTLSEKFLDVDPCYLFNDLAIVKKNAVELSEVDIADKPDGFGFRGVFINDEDLLQGWKDGGGARLVGGGYYYVTVAKTVIEKVVETVLRLKLNLVIPATFIDLDNPPEKDLADAVAERGIYLSQHHCEPLGVSSFTFENYCKKYGKTGRFSYSECPEIMENVWSFYVDKWAKYDNVVWQIGLRGLGDDRPIWQDDVPTEEVLEKSGKFISKAYQKEKDIILAATDGKARHFTSTLWMEGSALVEKGYLKFPESVTMVFADTAPTQLYGDEYDRVPREKDGKYGIYYHLQYYGCGPHLVPQTGLKKLYYNMKLAYDKGDRDYFIMNVSNVREFVFELKAYAESAWSMSRYVPDDYLNRYCEKFGEHADVVKNAITDFYESFPELDSKNLEKHLSTYFNYTKTAPPAGITNFVLKEGSIIDYGKRMTDNFDKADVFNILLQVLDDGRVTDSHGRTVNFENTVIVMTSNAGSERKEGTVGFGHTLNEQNRDRAMKALGEFLRPEFLNRVDEVICFNRLDEQNFAGIARIMLSELQKSLEDKGLHFTWDEAVEEYLVKKSYSATYGARNLRRTIQKELEDEMASQIIDSYEHPVTQLHAAMEDGKLVVRSL